MPDVATKPTAAADVLPTADPAIRTIAMPADTNPHGDIFGGWVLSQMDVAGGTLAARVAKGRVATVAITAMTFVEPIKVGDLIILRARVTAAWTTSLEVRVEVYSEGTLTGARQLTSIAYLTFVAIDTSGLPTSAWVNQSPATTRAGYSRSTAV